MRSLKPIWQCEFDNFASQALAEKLGFRHVGNVYSALTLLKNSEINNIIESYLSLHTELCCITV